MARGLALNPASLPFFPGGGMQTPALQKEDSQSSLDADIPGSFPTSSRSSPSPTQTLDNGRYRSSHDAQAMLRTLGADRSYPRVESRAGRDASMIGHIDSLSETEQLQHQLNGFQISTDSHPSATPSVIISPSDNNMMASPASSGSAPSLLGQHTPTEHTFDTHAKTSPFIHDILDRLIRCEYSNRELQRELSDVNRKLSFLVERTLANEANRNTHNASPTVGPTQSQLSISPPSASGSAPRPSSSHGDSLMAQRMETLTASVSQLLALHAQQQLQNANSPFTNSNLGVSHLNNVNMSALGGIAPDQVSPNLPGMAQLGLGHSLPNRPELGGMRNNSVRTPAPPGRTWSQGSLDLPSRPDTLARQDSLLNQKRRSIVGLSRRDSASTIDGDWGSNSREGGPVISKWEHLPLIPELLRSIAKYGVGPPNKIQQRALPFLLRGSDIIAQAPPTQERIAAYVIPAIHVALSWLVGKPPNRGPVVVIISTTVDQATQAQRMIRDLGGAIGVRSALGVGTGGDVVQEIRLLQQSMPHILCGTPQKLHALFTTPGGLTGSEVRFLVLDEVDQLIARNLHEFVFNIVKLLPSPRSRSSNTPSASPAPIGSPFNPFDSAINGSPGSPFPTPNGANNGQNGGRSRFPSIVLSPNLNDTIGSNGANSSGAIERQTALFSNTVPQDVLNLANAIQLREPVRVLVRRDGNVTHADTNNSTRGLRQFYLYLAFTAGGRVDPAAAASGGGLGIIGSGRGASSNAETTQAREWKLDALADLFEDIEIGHAIVHVGGLTALDNVVFKLASRGLEAVPLHGDMNAGSKMAALNKFRSSSSHMMRQPVAKVLVVYDVQVKAPDVFQVPLVINYDLPKAVEEYAHRVAPAISSSYNRAGVVINFVTATGGDVEMLRSIECFYKIKCPEVPMTLRDVI